MEKMMVAKVITGRKFTSGPEILLSNGSLAAVLVLLFVLNQLSL